MPPGHGNGDDIVDVARVGRDACGSGGSENSGEGGGRRRVGDSAEKTVKEGHIKDGGWLSEQAVDHICPAKGAGLGEQVSHVRRRIKERVVEEHDGDVGMRRPHGADKQRAGQDSALHLCVIHQQPDHLLPAKVDRQSEEELRASGQVNQWSKSGHELDGVGLDGTSGDSEESQGRERLVGRLGELKRRGLVAIESSEGSER